jgi:hypothetical protein
VPLDAPNPFGRISNGGRSNKESVMRKMVFGVALAVFAAVTVAIATPASAAISKSCWAHYDAELETYVPVWASGGGHSLHLDDFLLGSTETRTACEALFYVA